ncbi:SIMPL domain-containing protein [Paucibacter sp. PLA-PC-4]|uniref:SIMPL domain-containing protein n=1 Tax=Paucibacter sp. PLA-PC-4 TaxID=2993655 RepID=UPI00224A534B|nr:SIMPL domain-containing protein [Paucibacter sp. PLA-PC-4]MCX2863928.1 SIMPL domain-containing protein [Paucibacter sp. PLA-PC-4]
MTRKTMAALALMTLAPVLAQAEAPRQNALNLSATASQEVTRDVLGVSFTSTKEGSDAVQVQIALKQALDAALAEARKIAKPGQVEVQTGNFALYPRYAPKTGQINGWQGTAELQVEGKDTAAIAQLSGRIATMSIARVGYSLSREAREKVEGEVVAQAIARYKLRAADYARQFGFSGYQIGEVSVNTADSGPMPMAAPSMMRMKAAGMADEALPVEAGKATVSVSVNGVVVMTK